MRKLNCVWLPASAPKLGRQQAAGRLCRVGIKGRLSLVLPPLASYLDGRQATCTDGRSRLPPIPALDRNGRRRLSWRFGRGQEPGEPLIEVKQVFVVGASLDGIFATCDSKRQISERFGALA